MEFETFLNSHKGLSVLVRYSKQQRLWNATLQTSPYGSIDNLALAAFTMPGVTADEAVRELIRVISGRQLEYGAYSVKIPQLTYLSIWAKSDRNV